MLLKNNYHSHTVRCGHAGGSERDYVEAAISCGMEEFGFSDHAPYVFDGEGDYYSSYRMKLCDALDYVDTVNALKDEYKGKIKLYTGYELEYYPRFFDKTYKFLEQYGFDYLILGQHFTFNEVDGVYSYNLTSDVAQLKNYTDQVIEAMSTGLFLYVAHPDLFSFDGDAGVYESEARRLCEAALKYDMPLEINLLGLRDNRRYPVDAFWKVAGECGVKTILGIDAHSAGAVCNTSALAVAQQIIEAHNLQVIERPNLKDN